MYHPNNRVLHLTGFCKLTGQRPNSFLPANLAQQHTRKNVALSFELKKKKKKKGKMLLTMRKIGQSSGK